MVLICFLFIVSLTCNVSLNKAEGLRTEKMMGGVEARKSQFKYTVALMYTIAGKDPENPCVGAILSSWHIGTAAHCFYDSETGKYRKNKYYIIASALDIKIQTYLTKYITVDLVYIHKDYEYTKRANSSTKAVLAIAKLSHSLGLYEGHASLKALVTHRNKYRNDKKIFFVTGFGWNRFEYEDIEENGVLKRILVGKSDGKLRYLRATVLENEDCETQFHVRIAKGNLCAKVINLNRRNGICEGDSGAPLVHRNYLTGIAINGAENCDETEMPGFYINVLEYRKVVNDVITFTNNSNMRVLRHYKNSDDVYVFLEI